MASKDDPSPSEDNIGAFIDAVLGAFGTEPWDDVEPYIQRAWSGGRNADEPAWEDIRERVRSEMQRSIE